MADLNERIVVDADEGSARAAGDAIERALLQALKGIGAQISRQFASEFKKGSSAQDLAIGDAFGDLKRDAKDASKATGIAVSAMTDDLEALQREALATRREFQRMGVDKDLTAGFEVQARNITRLINDMREKEHLLANDDKLSAHYRELGLDVRRAFLQTSAHVGQTLDTISKHERAAATRDAATEHRRVAEIEAARSRQVASMQQETTRIRAENRVQEADIRASAQRRNAIFQAAAREFFAIQRAMGRIAVGTTRAISTAFSGIGRGLSSSLSRVGGLFRRQNREITSGLDGALDHRESIMRSSFNSQERIVQSSVITQSRQLDRLERTVSRGVIGAATGRSALGNLLGGGLAIGGGFAFVSVLRDGLTAGADFVQGLKVLDAQLGLTDKEMATVRETALDLGNDISLPGVSALDAAQAIQILSKQFAGLGKGADDAAVKAAKGVLQLSRAAKVGSEDAGQLVGAAVNVFGVSADRAVAVADQVTGALKNAAGVGFQDFALSFKQGAQVFEQFQGPVLGAEGALTEFNTALAVMARGGLTGSDAGTSLKQFFLQANRDVPKTQKALKGLAEAAGETGSVFFDQEGNARALGDSLGILREGLEGMSDQQRTSALQTIFGSDAMRAANALLKVSTPEYQKIRKAIQEQGLAAKIAAAQNTGLRGAMDALDSVIQTQLIKAYERFSPVIGDVVVKLADFANKVFSAGGGFAVFRSGVKGVVAALGGLLVIKTIAESFGLLRVAMRGLLTPWGAFAFIAAGIGGAIAILADASPEFAKSLDDIKKKVGGLAEGGLKLAQKGLKNLGDLLSRTVIPALQDAAEWVGERIGPAFEVASDFITDKALPALKDFASAVIDNVVPAAQAAWKWVGERLGPAFEAVGDFVVDMWARVEPVLTPFAESFRDLAEAIGDVEVSDGLLALGGVLAGIVAGGLTLGPLGAVIGGLGAAVGSAFALGLDDELLPAISDFAGQVLSRFGAAVADGFSFLRDKLAGVDWASVGFTVLDALEEIGFQIANILTDPIVLGIVAAAAAALATAAFRLVQGLARGIVDNMGELVDILGPAFRDALGEAFDFAFENPLIILGGLASLLAATSIFTAFRNFGKKGAQEIGRGMGEEFPRALNRFGRQGTFVQGLFGSPSDIRSQVSRSMSKIAAQTQTEIGILRERLLRGGKAVPTQDSLAAMGFSPTQIRGALRDQWGQLAKEIGPARAAGVQLRAAFTSAVTDFKGGKGLASSIGTFFTGAQGSMKQAGQSIGNTLALGIGSALAGFFAGQSGSSGLSFASILGSAAAGFATGGVAGGIFATAAASIGAFFGGAQAAAKKAKEEVQEYTDAILAAGSADLAPLAIGGEIAKNLADETPGVKAFFADMELSFEQLGDVITSDSSIEDKFLTVAETVGLTSDEMARLGEVLEGGIQFGEFDDLNEIFGRLGINAEDVIGIMDVLKDEGGEIKTALAGIDDEFKLADKAKEGETALDAAKTSAQDLGTAVSDAFAAKSEAARTQLDNLKTAADNAGTAADEAREELRKLIEGVFEQGAQEQVDDLNQAIGNLNTDGLDLNPASVLGQANMRDLIQGFREDVAAAGSAAIFEGIDEGLSKPQIMQNLDEQLFTAAAAIDQNPNLGKGMKKKLLAEITAAFDELKDPEVFAKITDVKGLDKVEAKTQAALERKAFKLKVQAEFNAKAGGLAGELATQIAQLDPGPARDALQAKLDELAEIGGIDLSSVGEGAADSLATGLSTGVANIPGIGTAIVESVTKDFDAGAFRPLGEGLVTSFAEGAAGATATVTTAGGTTAGAFATGITGANQIVSTAGEEASASATLAMQVIGIVNAVLAGTSTGSGFASGVSSQSGAASGAGSAVAGAAVSGASGHSLYGAGAAMASGMAAGLAAGAGAVYAVAAAIAAQAAAIIASVLKIGSPSRVTREMGQQFSEGFALGITDNLRMIIRAVVGVGDALTDAMQDVIDNRSDVFDDIFRSPRPGGIGDRASFAGAIDDLVKAVEDMKEAVREQNKERAKDHLPPISFDPGFDPRSDRGRENIGNFTGLVDAAKDILAAMVGAGKSTEEIKKKFNNMREDIIKAARAAGFSGKEIEKMLRQLDFTSGDFAKFIKDLKGADKDAAFDAFQGSFGELIETILDNVKKGSSNQDILTQIVRNLRQAGVSQDLIKLFRGDIIKFIQEWRKDPSRKANEQIEKFLKGLEPDKPNKLLERFGDEIASFVEENKGLGTDAALKQVIALMKSVGIDVTGKDRNAIREFISKLRSDKLDKFGDAIDKLTKKLEAGDNFVDRFSGQFDQIIEEFSDNPKRIREEINRALRAAGLGKQAKKYAKEINDYIREILRDPGRKLDEYLEKLLGEHETPETDESFRPEINIYPPSGDPEAQALVILNRLAGSRPRGY